MNLSRREPDYPRPSAARPCELPLHESANAQGPRRTFWMSFPRPPKGEALRLSYEECISSRHKYLGATLRHVWRELHPT
jgi:hypothetical protein